MTDSDRPTYQKPVPEITEAMRPFFEATREQRLVVQRCRKCATLSK